MHVNYDNMYKLISLLMYVSTAYLISDVHWDVLPIDAFGDYVEISTASSLEELFNIFSLKEMQPYCIVLCHISIWRTVVS